ncbi:acyltransferase, partial [Ralstonia solanacearum]
MNLNYRSDIDGLRAIAILSVFLYHAFPGVLPGGFIGVDVFFAISGFLISHAIFTGIDNKGFSFRDFYARRTRRIFPALVLVLAATYAAGLLILLPVELTRLGKDIAAAATFTLNFVLRHDNGYFDAAGEHNPVLHLWSLCIEEQFYFVLPPLFLIASKLRLNRLAVVIAIILGSFLLNVYMVGTQAT